MKLSKVIDSIPVKAVTGDLEVEISGVFFDSRKVAAGGLFCALVGQGVDGSEFIEAAVDQGAVAVISSEPYRAEFPAVWIEVENPRQVMGIAASNFEGHPSNEMPVVGVTGTNGKTTTTFLIHHLLKAALHRAGLVGTIHYDAGAGLEDAPHTTPESPDLQRLIREMVDNDCRGVAMEVSSHGLSQSRVAGVAFDVGVFTNLSQDHLDYHGTMESYFEAKQLLFEQMDNNRSKSGVALINTDDSFGARLYKRKFSTLKMVSYGRSVGVDYQISNLKSDVNGTEFKLAVAERQFLVRIPLIGSFNVYNAVAAIASAHQMGLNLRETVANMASSPQVPGRLEAVGDRQINYRVFVDYAHTPDALANVLETLKALEPARIITVFGCGGDRDVTKRAPMAFAAEQGSDLCVLTSDNPRTEDPQGILSDAEEGFRGQGYEVIEDRRLAIKRAIMLAEERDIVLIAGKGHESYQEIHGVRHDFDDRRVAASWIRQRAEGGGS
ncbi:MAG: UDP-N-acetylmuramoyl-L-alanyl-D-glutamate--2,6-diaminopimelate ligase [Verrucomicrobiota bacterium]